MDLNTPNYSSMAQCLLLEEPHAKRRPFRGNSASEIFRVPVRRRRFLVRRVVPAGVQVGGDWRAAPSKLYGRPLGDPRNPCDFAVRDEPKTTAGRGEAWWNASATRVADRPAGVRRRLSAS